MSLGGLNGRFAKEQWRGITGKTGHVVNRGADAARQAQGKVVATLTQKDNWESVERYLAEVVEVLAAQEAEIRDLRRQVTELARRLDSR